MSSRHGFTLIEVLIALALAGLVVLVAHRGINLLVSANKRAEEARASSMEAAAVRRQLVGWLHALELSGNPDAWDLHAESGLADGGSPDDRLLFTSRYGDDGVPVRRQLLLAIDRDPVTLETGLVVRPAAGGKNDTVDAAVSMIPQATGLSLRFLHVSEGERVWTSEWASSLRYPEAIEVRIHGDSVPPLLRLPIFVVPRRTG